MRPEITREILPSITNLFPQDPTMAEAAAGGGPPLPEDLLFWEILTRLPVKPLLRCRAVCRSWRVRLTIDAQFLLAHHRRQPSLPLLTTWDTDTHEIRIDTLDHRTGERHPVGRTPGRTAAAAAYESKDDLRVLASCDGLIILYAYHGLEICNPATRQRAPLTLLHGADCISALYPHRPSGSYRVLCCFKRPKDGHAVYRVHRLGSGELRCVGEPPGPWASGDLATAVFMGFLDPPILADGRLYWHPLKLPGGTAGNGKGKVNNMLVFDTMSESFQHLLSPVDGPFLELFEMNNGALGLYHYRGRSFDLWVLKDHRSWSWSMNRRIKLDVLFFSLLPALDPEGDVLVILWQYLHHVSGANGSLLARYKWSANLTLTRHRLKESLLRHDFFLMEGNAGGMDEKEKPLFDGLSTVAVLRDDNFESSQQDGVTHDSELSCNNSTAD